MTRSFALVLLLALVSVASGWVVSPSVTTTPRTHTTTALSMGILSEPIQKGYVPKWKKKATLAEQTADKVKSPQDVGLIGTVTVTFHQGNSTKSTLAIPGQPLSDVATQAGQFIKYGCGKGECGTCESLCDGKWIKPCQAVVPADVTDMVIQVKEVKNKSRSSGKFYSVRSFLMGFYNNLLGMIGFVRTRKYAKQNWKERQEFEEALAKRVEEKRKARAAAAAAAKQQQESSSS